MHQRGGEADGIHHGSAADDDDERLPVDVLFQQQPHETFDECKVVLGGFSAGNDLRFGGERDFLLVCQKVAAHFGRDSRV